MMYQDLQLWKGITFGPIKFYAKDNNGNAVNLSGWQAFSKTSSGLDLKPIITNPPTGEITINLTSAQTSTVPIGQYDWDMTFMDTNSNKLGPYVGGRFYIYEPITQ